MTSVVQPPGTTPTLQAVALRSGVSVSTASRCLSGAANVARATQQRVMAAARETGYHHNPLIGQVMSATRRGDTQNLLGTVAYVTPFEDSRECRATPTLCRHWNAARERAAAFGFGMSEFSIGAMGMSGRRLGQILEARGISGVLLAAFPREPCEILLPWDDFAFVQVGHCLSSPRIDCVISDHTEGLIVAARAMAERGCQRIGLAIENYQNEITDKRWSIGYAGLRATLPHLAEIPPLLPTHMTADLFLPWVERYRVDSVLTLSTFRNLPNPMEDWLAQRGLGADRDIGLASLDVTSVHSDWAGVEQHSDEIGRAAVDLLFAKLQARERGVPTIARTLQVHGHWRDGRTLHPKALASELLLN